MSDFNIPADQRALGNLATEVLEQDERIARLIGEKRQLRIELVKLKEAIWDLESAWFDYCQEVRSDVPEREIYDLLAINDGRLTMAEIEAQRAAPPHVQGGVE